MNTQITTCQVCGRAIKSAKGVIAHHGYQRPYGWHEQTASCAGARYAPYEVSCDRLKEVIEQVVKFLERQETEHKAFLENPPKTLIEYEKRGSYGREERREYTKPDNFNPNEYHGIPHTYGCVYMFRKQDYERTIRLTKSDLETMKRRLAEWKPADTQNLEENAGYIESSAYTGNGNHSTITIYNASECGMDVGKKYAVVCETHNCLVGTSSLTRAHQIMKCPDFCEKCMSAK